MANHKLDTDSQVFFYEQDFYVLSNFSAFSIKYRGYLFPTSEHLYQWKKFEQFSPLLARNVRRCRSAHEAFKLAESNADRRCGGWNKIKVQFMREVIRTKFKQHEYVRRKLKATGDRELIEDSWRDDYWGWGPNKDGQNMLGKLWMELRDEISHGK